MNCNEQGLNITALSKDKKGKGIKVRKKDSFIISLTSIQVVCKPVNKQEAMTGTYVCVNLLIIRTCIIYEHT